MAGERILVVDDEPMLRKLLADTLALEDFEVATAEDAESALKLMEKRSFDAAVLDIMMPKVTGIELLKRIREINKELPVIILTAYASKESAIEALRLGAHDYLEKPPERERLIHSIRRGIERRKLREENATLVKELQERAERLKLISQMGAAITSSLEMNRVLAMALEMSRRAVGAKTCFLLAYDEDERELICRVAQGVGETRESKKSGFINTKLSDLPVCFQEIADLTIQKKETIVISEAKKDPRFFSLSEAGWDVDSVISVPLLLRGKVLGAIQVINKADGKRFTKADEVFIRLTANFVSVALENAKLTAKLEESMVQLADYSKILEEKVKERTKELMEANEALEKTNQSLKEMQDRMVQE
jgi:DNA-binding response OmpR family regulator